MGMKYTSLTHYANANIQQDSPLLQDPNYERLLAAQVAGTLMMQGKTFKVKGAATPPALVVRDMV